MEHPTWRDIERAALDDTVLHDAVTLVRMGHASREEALIYAALTLAAIRRKQHNELVDWMSNSPVRSQGRLP